MSWWQRVRQAFVKPSSASSLKKNASENLSFLQKKYGDLAKDKGEDLRKTLTKSVSDYGKRAKDAPQRLKVRSAVLGRQARARAEEATSSLGKQLGDSARALPSKTVENGSLRPAPTMPTVNTRRKLNDFAALSKFSGINIKVATKAAQDAKAAGAEAAQNAASAGAKAATDAGRRATNKARDAIPKFGAYANDTGRRIAYVIFGAAFLYGLGSALPGVVARYYTEKDKGRRRDEERGGGDGGAESLSPSGAGEARGELGRESVLLGMVEQWLRDR
eukprot:jgi/Undpi1/9951/HiC_scaffold_28.g12405.m1